MTPALPGNESSTRLNFVATSPMLSATPISIASHMCGRISP